MAVVRTYKGRPVKRMREVAHGIRLTFYAAIAGQVGPQETVSQLDWQAHGDKTFVSDELAAADTLRTMTAQHLAAHRG